MGKIVKMGELASIFDQNKAEGLKTVLCHGVFDLLHIGHMRYLRQAAALGDVLAVTVTPDRFVDKGPGRPVFTESLRAEALASLEFVDLVAVNQSPTAEDTLRLLRPNLYVKGAEFKNLGDDPTGKIKLEAAVAAEVGTELTFVEDIVYSSSSLINQHFNTYSEELAQYLELVRQRYDLDEVLSFIDRLREAKVLVIGDAIIDEYAYCTPLGLSSKDPTVALKRLNSERFLGGSLAVARHVAGLAGRVDLYTILGRDEELAAAVKKGLPPSLGLLHDRAYDRPTVTKLRYVDNVNLSKILEIYDISDEPLPLEVEEKALVRLEGILPDYDLVLAADFGHGLITERMVELLSRQARFLAVNPQANAGNRGYHTIFRYPRADFASLARHELAIAFQNRRASEAELMDEVFRRLGLQTLLVTCGANGIKGLTKDLFLQSPAVAVRTVDRVGSGDGLFAVTAMLSWLGCPLELTSLIGNIAGAKMVEAVGNQISLEGGTIKKALTAMLK